jgi:MFS family permease
VRSATLAARGPLACFAALGIFWGAWAALIPDIKAQAHASDAELGLAMLVAGGGAIVGMLITGRGWRRAGWLLLPTTATLFALAALGPIAAGSVAILALSLFFLGAGSGALDVSMNAAVSDVESSSGARMMYGAHALYSLATLIGSLATGFARQQGATPLVVLGTVAVAIGIAGLATVRSARSTQRTDRARVADLAEAGRTESGGLGLLPAALAPLAVLCVMSFVIEDAAQNWSALHLERGLGAGPALGGAAPGIFAGAMFIGRSLGQRLGDRFSERALLSGGAALAAVGLAALAIAPSPAPALIGLAIAGAGIALVAPALYGRAGRTAAPRERAAAIARLTVFGYTGFIIGPALIGFVSQGYGLPLGIALLAVVAVLLSIGGALVLRGPDRADAADGQEFLKTGRV